MYCKVKMPAIRGVQSGREYYTVMFSLDLIPRFFYYDEEGVVPLEMRSQRTINDKRVPEIANYILYNDDWLFSSLTATVSGEVEFLPSDAASSDIGFLEIDMNAKFFINDGQHRRAGITEALKQNPELGKETISVVLFKFESIDRSNQIFADLNRYAQKPTKGLNVLFDYRDPLSKSTIDMINSIDVFEYLTDKEKVSLPKKSSDLFTLGSLYEANKNLLRMTKKKLETFSKEQTNIIIDFWREVIKHMPMWEMVRKGEIRAWEVREKYISSHSVLLQSLGDAGYYLLQESDWKDKLCNLEKINWHRNNKEWKGIVIAGNGRVVNSKPVVKLTSLFIRKKLGLKLTEAEEESLSIAVS